jgi:hypothetical protein
VKPLLQWKAISITYSECVFVAVGIQHAVWLLNSHLWPGRLYITFPHYTINGIIFFKKIIEHKMCILTLSTNLSETFLILRRTEPDMIQMYNVFRMKCPLYLFRFNGIWIFSTYFRRILKFQISWQSIGDSRAVSCGQKKQMDRRT